MDVTDQKRTANFFLKRIELLDPKAIVAGGAPRDWHFGRQAADIDIFMHLPRLVQGSGALRGTLHALTGYEFSVQGGGFVPSEDQASEYAMNSAVQDVYQTTALTGQKVQVIRLSESTHGLLNTFPLSISKAWYKGGKIHQSEDFRIGAKYGVIWKTLSNYDKKHKYIQKVLAKFPDFKYHDSRLAFLESLIDL